MKLIQGLVCFVLGGLLMGCTEVLNEPLGKIEKPGVIYHFNFKPNTDLDYWRLSITSAMVDVSGDLEIRFRSLNHTLVYATSPTASQEYLESGRDRLAFAGPAVEVVGRRRSIVLSRISPGSLEIEVTIVISGTGAEKGLPLDVSMVHEPKPL